MLVAGKTMAQTFKANAATRLHPVEWTTGEHIALIVSELKFSAYHHLDTAL